MRRNGFTMVELIFVIIIIGILSVAAIPKFGDIKDRAKINAEYSSLSGLDSAIIGAIEFHAEDNNGDVGVAWHGQTALTLNDDATDGYNTTTTGINAQGQVLSKIVKKGEDLQIVAFSDLDALGKDSVGAGTGTSTQKAMENDVLFIEGVASNHTTGVVKSTDVDGKPDRNDVWVFNGSPVSITIGVGDGTTSESTVIESGGLVLIDVPAETPVTYVAASSTTAGDVWITATSDSSARAITSY